MNHFKYILIFLSAMVVVFVSMMTGAVADRLFVIKPIDAILPRLGGSGQSSQLVSNRVLQEENTVVDVAEAVADGVVTVSIKTERVVSPFSFDPFGMFGRGNYGGQSETIEQDIGTGFVVEGGLVVTNKHVVNSSNATYRVIDKAGDEYEVTNIYRDPLNDLSILQVTGAEKLKPIELGDSGELKVGQFVIAIGTALGEFRHTVTTGVISGLGRGIQAGSRFGGMVEQLDGVIQTDAAINPGNSGGPLLNSIGQVIGINTAVSSSGENIGFAIPVNVLKASLENFETTGRFDRAFLGVSYQNISREQAILNDVPAGAFIREVVPGSAAESAGLEAGDIIVRLDGNSLVDESSLVEIINTKKVGDRIEIEYWRNGEFTKVTVTLTNSSAATN